MRRLPMALKRMIKNEEGGKGEISSFEALCTALSATIGTGNIVGVATAVCAGGPGALFWMIVAAFFGMATKFSEGLLAIKYRVVDKDGHSLGGPFYYIEQGMGSKWKWLAKIFAFFGVCVGLFGIGTFSQVNGIASAIQNFFDPNKVHTVAIPGIGTYSWTVVIASLILAFCVGAVLIGGIKRIASVSQIVVPFMAVAFIVGGMGWDELFKYLGMVLFIDIYVGSIGIFYSCVKRTSVSAAISTIVTIATVVFLSCAIGKVFESMMYMSDGSRSSYAAYMMGKAVCYAVNPAIWIAENFVRLLENESVVETMTGYGKYTNFVVDHMAVISVCVNLAASFVLLKVASVKLIKGSRKRKKSRI